MLMVILAAITIKTVISGRAKWNKVRTCIPKDDFWLPCILGILYLGVLSMYTNTGVIQDQTTILCLRLRYDGAMPDAPCFVQENKDRERKANCIATFKSEHEVEPTAGNDLGMGASFLILTSDITPIILCTQSTLQHAFRPTTGDRIG